MIRHQRGLAGGRIPITPTFLQDPALLSEVQRAQLRLQKEADALKGLRKRQRDQMRQVLQSLNDKHADLLLQKRDLASRLSQQSQFHTDLLTTVNAALDDKPASVDLNAEFLPRGLSCVLNVRVASFFLFYLFARSLFIC